MKIKDVRKSKIKLVEYSTGLENSKFEKFKRFFICSQVTIVSYLNLALIYPCLKILKKYVENE